MSCIAGPPGAMSPGTRSGTRATARPSTNDGHEGRSDPAPRQELLNGDEHGNRGHPRDAHHSEREQRGHQCPAAADAPDAVSHTHPNSSERAGSPVLEQEAEGAAAMSQADVLERGELVDGGRDDHTAGQHRSAPVPAQDVDLEGAPGLQHDKADEPGDSPRAEVTDDEQSRSYPHSVVPALASRCLQPPIHHDCRPQRWQHHRGHHHRPHTGEEADRPGVGPRARVRVTHPPEHEAPTRRRDDQQRNDRQKAVGPLRHQRPGHLARPGKGSGEPRGALLGPLEAENADP
jgi:hypothetical protein